VRACLPAQNGTDIHRGPADAAVRVGNDGTHARADRAVLGRRVLVRAVLRVRGAQLAGRRHARGLRHSKVARVFCRRANRTGDHDVH